MLNMPWKCPECEETIDEMYYEVSTTGYESGTSMLSKTKETTRGSIIDDYDYGDSGVTEWDGDPTYKCKECDAEIDPTELIWTGDEEDEEEEEKPIEPPETLHKIIIPKLHIICNDKPKDSSNSSLICKECRHVFCVNGGKEDWGGRNQDGFHECPICGTSNTLKEYKELLAKNFFAIKTKQNGRKKTKRRFIKSLD